MKPAAKRPVIRSVRLQSVRSHADSTFEFSPGLNVIVGASDSGKSNLVRSLRALTVPPPAASFVRQGSVIGQVALAFTDGSTVRLARQSSGPGEYVAADPRGKPVVTLKNPGRALPPNFVDFVGVGATTLSGETVDLNIQSQRDSAMLIDDAPGRIGRIIGSVSGAAVAFLAVGEGKSRMLAANKAKSECDSILADRQRRLAPLAGRAEAMRAVAASVGKANSALDAADQGERQLEGLRAVLTDLASLGPAPDAAAIAQASEKIDFASHVLGRAARLLKIAGLAADLGNLPPDRTKELEDAKLSVKSAEANLQAVRDSAPRCSSCGQPIAAQAHTYHRRR